MNNGGTAVALCRAMEWLNYHHLLYFWMVAREGTVARAGEELRLAQPTISGQIRALEEALDQKLFVRSGRHLALTEIGRLVYRYADEIFGVGQELLESVKGERPTRRAARIAIGITNGVPKQILRSLLAPAWHLDEQMQVICREGAQEQLAESLAADELDVMVSDAPLPPTARVKAYNHLVGESPVAFFAVSKLAAQHRVRFPGSLNGAPLLLPSRDSAIRRALDEWFEAEGLHPAVIGEYNDDAFMDTCGKAGLGLFPAPVALREALRREYGVMMVGTAARVVARVYLITPERRLAHPAVMAIAAAAKAVFGTHEKSTGAGHRQEPGQEPASLQPQVALGSDLVTAPADTCPVPRKLRMAKGSLEARQPHAQGVSA